MKNLLLIACLISCYTFITCEVRKCSVHGMYDGDAFCINNGTGYESYMCDDLDPWNDYNVWVHQKTVMCRKGHKCRCWEDDWFSTECECYNARTPPSFPPTGVIRWNGTFYFDDFWAVHRYNPRTVYIPGEITKDSSGHFLYKWTKIGRWPSGKSLPNTTVHFKILIPSNHSFLEYTGIENGKKECSKKVVKHGGDLTDIWSKYNREGKTFSLQSSNSKGGSSKLDIETWAIINYFEDGMDEKEWTVEYDSEKDYAIPIKYYYLTEDGFNYEQRITKLNYHYEQLKKDDESFQLKDYCKE